MLVLKFYNTIIVTKMILVVIITAELLKSAEIVLILLSQATKTLKTVDKK